MAWLEEHGIGACSGREYHLARERRPRENTPPCPTGTHTAASMLILIPVLFVSPSPIPSPHLSSTVSGSVLVSDIPPHGVVTGTAVRICLFLSSFLLVHHPYTPPHVFFMHGPTPTLSERCVRCLSSTPSMARSSPSSPRVEETRSASLEEPGIGACSGREFLWETEKKTSEKLRLSHIGTENQCLLANLDSINTKTNTSQLTGPNANDMSDINTSTDLEKC